MANNTIIIKGDGIQYEADADAAIIPGQLVELLSTGKVKKVAAAGVDVERAVAIEDYVQGNDIADAYAADDVVFYRIFGRGEEFLAILADGEDVAIGAALESAGAGEVQAATSGGATPMFIATQAIDASDSIPVALVNRRIIVRVK